MTPQILGFSGRYRFLSNFYPVKFSMYGHEYASSENAYMSYKTKDLELRRKIRVATTPARAKQLGRSIELRPDWESIKVKVMLCTLVHKFSVPEMRELLAETGDAYLEETNNWGDIIWGVCDGKGMNMLGKTLMYIRANPNLDVSDKGNSIW